MSDTDKQALLNETATIQTKLEILPQIEGEDSIVLTEDNGVISWNHEDFRFVAGQGFIGQFVARQVTGELKNISDDFSITDREFILWLGVKINDNITWYSLGNFLVTKVTDDEVNDKTSFEALDYTKKFNKIYEDSITYPCTASQLAQNVCEQCGCELGDTNFLNNDYVIEGNVFTNNETCRDVMKEIGKLAYSWVRFDWDNNVYLDFTVQSSVDTYNVIDNSIYYNLKTQKEDFGPVNRVIIGYGDIEGERTKIEDEDSIEENGLCEITIYDNPLVFTQAQRESIINSAEFLLGMHYKPLNTLTVGHPWLKGNELIEIVDMENNTLHTIPLNRTIQYFGHIKTLIDVQSGTKTNTEYAYEANTIEKFKNTEVKVNKIENDITAIASATDENSSNISQLQIKNENITTSVENLQNNYDYYFTTQNTVTGYPILVENAGNYKAESLTIYGTEDGITGDISINVIYKINDEELMTEDDEELMTESMENILSSSFNIDYYTYNLSETLYALGDVYDEFDLPTGKLISRIGVDEHGELFILTNPIVNYLTPLNIQLYNGSNEITMDPIPSNIKVSYLTASVLNGVYVTKTELIQNNSSIQAQVTEEIISNGVSKVTNTTGTFDENGLTIEKTGANTKTNLNEDGMKIIDSSGGNLLTVDHNGVNAPTFTGDEITIGTHILLKDYELEYLGFYYIG